MAGKITLDANTPELLLESDTTGGTYSEDGSEGSTLTANAQRGLFEARNNIGVAQVSASGVFCNRAGTRAMPASTGIDCRGAIVGLGFGSMNKDDWQNENFIAGVYGRASNSGTAPAYGAYFQDLLVAGLSTNLKSIDENSGTTYLSAYATSVLGLSSSQKTVYLPNDGVLGKIIFAKQIGTGYMRFYPRSGQYIYDDDSANDYYDIGNGQMGIFFFVRFYVHGSLREVWTVSRHQF